MTGADGFVGRYLVRRLLAAGHEVVAAVRPGAAPIAEWEAPRRPAAVRVVPLELTDDATVREAVADRPDAVVHLAAVASNREARRDPGLAWTVNAAGTARLAEAVAALRAAGAADPLLLVVSTGEVYGTGPARPRRESDPPLPQSPYAASKVGAEVAALEVWRRSGVRTVVARPFTHTGPGQPTTFVLPAFVARLRAARRAGAATVPVGNLAPVRDLLHVRDVVEAYLRLLEHGESGEIYNVARGEGVALAELFRRVAELVGAPARPEPDPALLRAVDLPHLVGDSTKLRRATGWAPAVTLDELLQELVNAETD